MADPSSEPSFDLEQHERFQHREWKVRRIAGAVFVATLVAAALGVFGGGPLSHASATDGGVSVRYDRFARRGRASSLTVRLDRSESDTFTIAVGDGYFDDAILQTMFPRPTVTTDSGGVQRFTFAAREGEPAVVRFSFLPPSPGLHRGRVLVNDADLPVSTFVYP